MKLSRLLSGKKEYFSSPCGGRGVCGKCAVRVGISDCPVSKPDTAFFSKEDLEKGYRLACQMEVEEDFDISLVEIVNPINDMAVLTTDSSVHTYEMDDKLSQSNGTFDIAIDIGTSTLAYALVSGDKVVDTVGKCNEQCKFGADVISRIQAANSGDSDILNKIIISNLKAGIELLIEKNKIEYSRIGRIAITGNTVMLHILLNYSLAGLAGFPFKTVSLEGECRDAGVLLRSKELENVKVYILPGISAFVGADILAGLYYVENHLSNPGTYIFVDLGTNGEMALVAGHNIYVTSTAAGPAFEGVNITCGCPGVSGAISDISIDRRHNCRYTTIGNRTPIGICGSGIVSAVSEMLEQGIIDNNGSLIDKYIDDGYRIIGNIILTSKDIREFQMAKSAIKSGMEILVKRANLDMCDIGTVYVSGGFGSSLDIPKALKSDIFPNELQCEFKGLGNTSLKGGIEFLSDSNCNEKCESIKSRSKEIILANDELFNDLYIDNLNFS